jgi:hypothetical protein
MSIYLNNPWNPLEHQIITDPSVRKKVHQTGYAILQLPQEQALDSLRQLFNKYHDMSSDEGGMFYSIYSQNLGYRASVHYAIKDIIKPFADLWFNGYKMMLNAFVVKLSGPKSGFYVHQDTTGLDEWNYSPLSLWIPLLDVDENNGCLGIIPHSHWFFSPYRSISFPAPFDHIQPLVRQYLRPLRMQAGEVLLFDNRLVHHSYQNQSGAPRVAVVCGLFPEEAKLITCHKPQYQCGGMVELIEHEDDYLLKGKNFYIDCQKRPETGKSLGWIEDPYYAISEEEFETLCARYQLAKYNQTLMDTVSCKIIAEPS